MRDEDKDLNLFLSARAAPPPPPSDLEMRIILGAQSLQTRKEIPSFEQLWRDMRTMMVLPHPEFTLAACLVLGLVTGLQAAEGLTILSQEWAAFLEINEGGWL